jgi:hypothetical protein
MTRMVGKLYSTFVLLLTNKKNKMVQKNEFMLVFRYEPNNNNQPTEAEMHERHQQWGAFIGNIAIQEKLVSTHQLSMDGKQILSDKSLKASIFLKAKHLVET